MIMQQIVNGITLGSLYSLMAIGYAMVFSLLQLINFAHGQIFMMGSFFGLYLLNYTDLNPIVAFILALIITGILGILVEKTAVAHLRKRKASKVSSLISTLGVGTFLQNFALIVFGSSIKTFEAPFPIINYEIFGVIISSIEIVILLLSIILVIILNIFIYKTKYGVALRSCAQDIDTTQLMGVNANNMIALTFSIGSILAAAAGILVGIYYNSVEPSMGAIVGLKGFIASVLGGVGMISGGMLGGFILGVLENLGTAIFTAQYRDIISFTVLIIVLLIRPEGILGKKGGK